MDGTVAIIVSGGVGAFFGLNTKIVYNWLSRRGNGSGNGDHHAPCEYLRLVQQDNKEFRKDLKEVLQRVTRIETKVLNGDYKK